MLPVVGLRALEGRVGSTLLMLEQQPRARWYAEKLAVAVEPLVDAGLTLRVIDCLRDPRDIVVSIRAFVAATGFDGFGQRPGDTDEEHLERFIGAVGDRLDEMAATPSAVDRITLRYEDFARDRAACARQLGAWLGVAFDPTAVDETSDQMRRHRTAPSVDASINRWTDELSPGEADRIWDALGDRLEVYGYTARPG